MIARRLLRWAAVLIAVAGAVDPAWTRARVDRPTISIVDAGDRSLTASLSRALASRYDIVSGADAGADVTLLAGPSLPAVVPPPAGALVAVVPDGAEAPRVTIERVTVAPVTAEGSSTAIEVGLVVRRAAGRRVRVEAVVAGVAVDRRVQPVTSDDDAITLTLAAPALARGLAPIQVRVTDDAGADTTLSAEASAATEVRAVSWPVLVHDTRPAWMSTFVRRALEADRRFVVAARQTTSRDLATESGGAPASLTTPGALDAFAVVVVGAPEAVSSAEVQALDRFARTRGGTVVLLMDHVDTGPFLGLTGAAGFTVAPGTTRRPVTGGDAAMLATELAVPARLSPLATPLATADAGPMVWSVPAGAGQVVVSAALDTWRYRTTGANGFARFWSRVVADAAAAAAPPVELVVSRQVRAGAPVEVRVRVRAAALAPAGAPTPAIEARAAVTDARGERTVVPLWPAPERGLLAGTWTPPVSGRFRIAADAGLVNGATLGTDTAEVVATDRARVLVADVADWTRAHGGTVVTRADPAAVASAVDARLSRAARPAPWYPMRSPWWLPLFLLALGGEWWLRRHGGYR